MQVVQQLDFEDITADVKSAGSPIDYVLSRSIINKHLPSGAASHIFACDDDVRDKLERLLIKYAKLFPTELPF